MVAVLTAINVWLGVLLSLTGSIAVAPQAVPQLWKLAKHDARLVRGHLARFLPFLRRSATVHAVAASGSVHMTAAVLGVTGKVTHNGPLEEQVNQLWAEIDLVRGDITKLRSDTVERAEAIERSVKDVDHRERDQHEELLRRLQEAEEQQTEFNARALPLIGFGIVLMTAAGWLAQRPIWVNAVVVVFVLALSVRVVGPIASRSWRRRQEERRATSTGAT